MNGNGHYIPAEPINHYDDDDDGGAAKDHSRKKRKRRRIPSSHRWWWILTQQYWHHGNTASRVLVTLVIASLCIAMLVILSLNVANDDFTNKRNRWRRRAAERLATIEASQKQRQQKQKLLNKYNTDEQEDGDGASWKQLMKKAEQDKMFNGNRRRYRFTDPRHLPPINDAYNPLFDEKRFLNGMKENQFLRMKHHHKTVGRPFFFRRLGQDGDGKEDPTMEWVKHANEILSNSNDKTMLKGPKVDYTKHKYAYPTLMMDGPPTDGTYPPLEPLQHLMQRWPQDSIDEPPTPFVEQLQHFDFSDPKQRRVAEAFRNAELPFKVYNVPEVELATEKWTDEYVSAQFDMGKRNDAGSFFFRNILGGVGVRSSSNGDETASPPAKAHGRCQESDNNFFEFFTPETWDVSTMGLPPTRDNDFTYEVWSKHARYADAIGLRPNEIHYYWQSGVPREERYQSYDTWTFVSRDLPSFSSVEPTFFCTSPDKQKGIQCRFGERGVTAATHYDGGKNMVAMITGAKRYVLSPPKACSKLGIVTTRGHPIFRHSNLNFGHLNLLPSESLLMNGESDGGKQEEEEDEDDEVKQFMSSEEREWLKRASGAMAVETVLKAGEVLYIPSHWFHYITSLQKSAQCNVRSGKDLIGTKEFGGFDDVDKCDGG